MDIDEFFEAYVVCALWSSTYEADNDGEPVNYESNNTLPMDDRFGPEDVAPTTLETMRRDCEDFIKANEGLLGRYLETRTSVDAGHDFWLTRNGHGAGFWDRGLGQLGKDLTTASKSYGSFDLYVGDDGLVYGS